MDWNSNVAVRSISTDVSGLSGGIGWIAFRSDLADLTVLGKLKFDNKNFVHVLIVKLQRS